MSDKKNGQALATPDYVEDPNTQAEKTDTAAHILLDEQFPHPLLIFVIVIFVLGSLTTMSAAINQIANTPEIEKVAFGAVFVAMAVFHGLLMRIARGKKEMRSLMRYAKENSQLRNKLYLKELEWPTGARWVIYIMSAFFLGIEIWIIASLPYPTSAIVGSQAAMFYMSIVLGSYALRNHANYFKYKGELPKVQKERMADVDCCCGECCSLESALGME